MYSKEEILARLAKGEEAESIAQEIVGVLNKAIEEYEETGKVQKQKEAAAQKIVDAVCDFLETYYPDLYDAELRTITGKDVAEAADRAYEEVKSFKSTIKNYDQLLKDYEATKKVQKQKITRDTDPISDFLAKYVDN